MGLVLSENVPPASRGVKLLLSEEVIISLGVITAIAFAMPSLLCITLARVPTISHEFSLLKVGRINCFFT